MKEKEYEILCEKMKTNNELRNNLLTFSFTSVLAVLGIAFTNITNERPEIYLLPFFLIVPFSARVTYYRISEARINACIFVFGKNLDVSRIKGDKIQELDGFSGKIIASLVNYEMLFLSLLCTILFYIRYPINISGFKFNDWVLCGIPLLLSFLVFSIIRYARDYGKLFRNFVRQWQEVYDDSTDASL